MEIAFSFRLSMYPFFHFTPSIITTRVNNKTNKKEQIETYVPVSETTNVALSSRVGRILSDAMVIEERVMLSFFATQRNIWKDSMQQDDRRVVMFEMF